MWGLPSPLGIFAIGFACASNVWFALLKSLAIVVGGATNFFEKLREGKPRESMSSNGKKFELPDLEEESAFLEEEEELKPPPKVNPLNSVLSDYILPEILKHLDADSLKSSRLVSRLWCQLATPILASKAAVHLYTVDMRMRRAGVEGRQGPIVFDLAKCRHVNHFKNFLAWRDSKEEASNRQLISYQHFKVTFASWLPEATAIFPQNMRFFLTPQVQESLVSLTVRGRHLDWLRFALGNLPHLKSLKLEISSYNAEGDFAANAPEEEQNQFNVEPGNFPDLPKLEELIVLRDDHHTEDSSWHWIFKASPSLSSVELKFGVDDDLHSALEALLRWYCGDGLRSLSCEKYSYALHHNFFVRDSPRLTLVLHHILNSDSISRGLKFFSCNVLLTPHQWASVFRTTRAQYSLGSPLETLKLSLSIADCRAEYSNDFLLFCPTFAGEAYLKRLTFLELYVVDEPRPSEWSRHWSSGSSSDEEPTLPSPKPIRNLRSSRLLPQLETFWFLFAPTDEDVDLESPWLRITQSFLEPTPNLVTLMTDVFSINCVYSIFRHMPIGLKKLWLRDGPGFRTYGDFPFKVEDFAEQLDNAQSIEKLTFKMQPLFVTDEFVQQVFLRLRNLKKLVFGTLPKKITAQGWSLLQEAEIETFFWRKQRFLKVQYPALIRKLTTRASSPMN